MIILANTTDQIQIVLDGAVTTNQLKCISSWRDITTNLYTPGRTITNTNNTTDVDIVPAPSSSTQRVVDFISIYNTDTASSTITIKYDSSGTDYIIFKVTLLTGEALEYNEGSGWIYYSSTGTVKATQPAAGNNTEIQFNNSGVFGASSDLTFDSITNTLGLNGTNTGVQLHAITTEPGVQSSGLLRVYSKAVCGKIMLKQVGPSGLDTPLQNAIWQNNTVLFTPGAAAGVWQGTVGANLGTPVIALPTVTNLATMLRRSNFPSVVTTANQQVGTRSEAMFFRGNAAGLGGFFFVCRFMLATWTTTNRLFVGLGVGTTAMVTGNPSGLLNLVGFGVDTADTAITFMHNDGTGTATKEPITGQPALATNQGYVAYIFCKPNDTVVYFRLDDINTGTTIIDSSVNSELPVNTTALVAHCCMSNGPTNIVAGNATIGVNRIYIETDI